ncbi:hypothetical protein F511_44465 [Dorcoceras hygrometricum]|uniref:Cytochrome c-552/DMSO reductase-like haem-binding domain-containing protein n=1 Tax=Dorcoceras hygrometricum TaxID=472368 RepID=A0A2Z7A5E3_9LAMI|nr:hypothetical protein F511_44465 [Dorcoceras hygrometricum]
MALPFVLQLFVGCLAISSFAQLAEAHQESGEWDCDADEEARIVAQFLPGIVTVDGQADDWADVDGFEFPLRPALDPDEDKEYKSGKMSVKALHDGTNMYFMLQVDGEYLYTKGDDYKCPSVALMFQIGDDATYHNMGGCKESPDTCNSTSCRGHEVDIIHFSLGNSIPGRLYGEDLINVNSKSGGFGLVDMYSWNPHCRNTDGHSASGENGSTALNNWKAAWWHSSFTTHAGFIEDDSPYSSSGQKGTYYFEFSRPLRTMDRLQRDAQFSIGQSSKFSAAFWYLSDGKPWHGSEHYTIGCDWIPMDVTPGFSAQSKVATGSSWDAAAGFAFLLSFVSFCVSIFVGYWVSKTKSVSFTPIDRL